jgi:hypothetical protein
MDQFKYPPMDLYLRYINPCILDQELDQRYKKVQFDRIAENTRISPMLKKYFEGGRGFPKNNASRSRETE